ncbi:MAG TPA: Ig-like domain-containing protein [Verrucomicrobiae bacterium]|nr:Ig-like domain-containing protein [Verrucomicrobiae bacterium]
MQLLRSWGRFLVLTLLCLVPIAARADVLVYVTMFSLSPDPVTISVGQAVFWTDGDGGGPYGIYGIDGWSTQTDSYGIQFNQAGTYSYYDDNGNYGTIYVNAANVPPAVLITAPANNAVFPAPATFDFTAMALDPDSDGIMDVQFYVGTTLADDLFNPPYTTSITNLSAGTYTLTAVANDNGGASATNSISITVGTIIPPSLAVSRMGNQLVISWETNQAAGLTLQSTTDLVSGATWTPVPIAPVQVGSQLVVTNPIAGPRQFFRLSNR